MAADHRTSRSRVDEELRALAGALSLHRLSIEGPVYGDAKLGVLRAADLFVLPILNESFGITVAEALAAGTSVIATTAPMPRTWLRAMGAKGQAWIARDLSWGQVARDMPDVYNWLLHPRAAAGERVSRLIARRIS